MSLTGLDWLGLAQKLNTECSWVSLGIQMYP